MSFKEECNKKKVKKKSKNYASVKTIQISKNDGTKVEKLEMHENNLEMHKSMKKNKKKTNVEFLESF